MDIRAYLNFLAVAEKLKCNTRHSWTSTGRHESVAEHSWRLALMAYLVRDEFPELDMDRVIQMCLFHDMGEAVTGDIPAFEKSQADEETEKTAVSRLVEMLPEPCRSEVGALYDEMEARKTPEAKLIQHNEADISTWLPLEYDLQMTYGQEECEAFPYIRRLREIVRQDSVEKINSHKKIGDNQRISVLIGVRKRLGWHIFSGKRRRLW